MELGQNLSYRMKNIWKALQLLIPERSQEGQVPLSTEPCLRSNQVGQLREKHFKEGNAWVIYYKPSNKGVSKEN